MRAPPYRLSVVVPTYQRRAAVRRLLDHLARQTLPAHDYEVIISIDGSDDGTREMANRFPAPYALRVLWQPHSGRAAACNAGIRAACGEVVVLLDDDMAPAPGCLSAHLAAHADGARRGVLGAVPIDANGSSPPVTAYIAAKFNQHLATLARADHVFTLRDFYSGNFSMRRERFLEVGLLDEAFERYGNEDLELWLRLSRAGIQLKYEAEALARQYYTKSFSELSRDTISKGRTAVLLASKHPEAFAHLKLATFHQASYKWRLARAALLGLSATLPPTPAWVIRLVELVERRRPRRLWVLYDFVLDYCYWLGARLALRESRLRETGA